MIEATGLEKGGIYRHFDGKAQLASEASRARHSNARFRIHFKQCRMAEAVYYELYPPPVPMPGGRPLFNTAVDADDGNPVLRQLALRALRGWRDDLSQAVKRGIERRKIKREINPKELADIIISSLEGALMMSRLEGDKEALPAAQSFLNSYLDTQIWCRR